MAITVPPGFTIDTIAHVAGARELAVTPDGDLFVGTSGNNVYLVRDPEKVAQTPQIFVTLPENVASGLTFARNTLYVGTQFAVYRVAYRSGETHATGAPQKIASVRTSGEPRGHRTTSLAFANDKLYASVGSSCNACDPEADATRATIQEMAPDGSGMHAKAVHFRNAIALATNPSTGTVWAAGAEQDALAAGHPYEPMDPVSLHPGTVDYGWPHCYENRKPADPSANCSAMQPERVVFPAYMTPIGAAFYPQHPTGRYVFPREYWGGAFVALHGSWHQPLRAPEVAFVAMRGDEPDRAVDWNDPTKQSRAFVSGFQAASTERLGRPTGVAVGRDDDLFVADDLSGAIYRIRPAHQTARANAR